MRSRWGPGSCAVRLCYTLPALLWLLSWLVHGGRGCYWCCEACACTSLPLCVAKVMSMFMCLLQDVRKGCCSLRMHMQPNLHMCWCARCVTLQAHAVSATLPCVTCQAAWSGCRSAVSCLLLSFGSSSIRKQACGIGACAVDECVGMLVVCGHTQLRVFSPCCCQLRCSVGAAERAVFKVCGGGLAPQQHIYAGRLAARQAGSSSQVPRAGRQPDRQAAAARYPGQAGSQTGRQQQPGTPRCASAIHAWPLVGFQPYSTPSHTRPQVGPRVWGSSSSNHCVNKLGVAVLGWAGIIQTIACRLCCFELLGLSWLVAHMATRSRFGFQFRICVCVPQSVDTGYPPTLACLVDI
jgi:hypothetical protein